MFHCSNNRNPTASELQQLTLLDFQDGENASAAQKASNEKEREAILKELSDSNVRKYVTILNHLYNKAQALAFIEDWAKAEILKDRDFGWGSINFKEFRDLDDYQVVLVLEKIKTKQLIGAAAINKYCIFLMVKKKIAADFAQHTPSPLQKELEGLSFDKFLQIEFDLDQQS